MEKSIWKMWHIMLGIGSITIMSSQSCTHLVQNIVKLTIHLHVPGYVPNYRNKKMHIFNTILSHICALKPQYFSLHAGWT